MTNFADTQASFNVQHTKWTTVFGLLSKVISAAPTNGSAEASAKVGLRMQKRPPKGSQVCQPLCRKPSTGGPIHMEPITMHGASKTPTRSSTGSRRSQEEGAEGLTCFPSIAFSRWSTFSRCAMSFLSMPMTSFWVSSMVCENCVTWLRPAVGGSTVPSAARVAGQERSGGPHTCFLSEFELWSRSMRCKAWSVIAPSGWLLQTPLREVSHNCRVCAVACDGCQLLFTAAVRHMGPVERRQVDPGRCLGATSGQ